MYCTLCVKLLGMIFFALIFITTNHIQKQANQYSAWDFVMLEGISYRCIAS